LPQKGDHGASGSAAGHAASSYQRKQEIQLGSVQTEDVAAPQGRTIRLTPNDRRHFIGGSDFRVIVGDAEEKLIQFWLEKRGEADLSDNLIVQLGAVTGVLNRAWYQHASGQTIKDIHKRVRHPVHKWMAATLDGMVEQTGAMFEAKFMSPWAFTEEAATEKHGSAAA
jgi:predicted phage-related endonuclease